MDLPLRELRIAGTCLGPNLNVNQLSSVILRLQSLERLDLSDNRISSFDFLSVLTAIRHHANLVWVGSVGNEPIDSQHQPNLKSLNDFIDMKPNRSITLTDKQNHSWTGFTVSHVQFIADSLRCFQISRDV